MECLIKGVNHFLIDVEYLFIYTLNLIQPSVKMEFNLGKFIHITYKFDISIITLVNF